MKYKLSTESKAIYGSVAAFIATTVIQFAVAWLNSNNVDVPADFQASMLTLLQTLIISGIVSVVTFISVAKAPADKPKITDTIVTTMDEDTTKN